MAGTNKVSPEFTVVDGSTTPSNTPGTVVQADGREYRYVKNQATDSATANYPVVYMDADPHDNEWEITADLSDGVAAAFGGVAVATIGAAEYGWIVRDGVWESCAISDSVQTGGHPLWLGTQVDRYFQLMTAGDIARVCGVGTEVTTAAGTAVAVYIKGL